MGPDARLGWRSIHKLSNGVRLVLMNYPPPKNGTLQPKSGFYSGTIGHQGGDDYSLPRPASFKVSTANTLSFWDYGTRQSLVKAFMSHTRAKSSMMRT
jgi:hypothetical protein